MARILLVGDDTTGLEIRKLLLEHAGHRVVAVSDPGEALAQCREIPPDVVVVDVRLPDARAGLALIRDLHDADSGMHVIVLCGSSTDLDGRPEREFVDEVLSKPVRSERLLTAVTMKAS